MPNKHDKKPHDPKQIREEDKKQASILIQVTCVVALGACILASIFKDAQISLFTYAIFGGGILGTDNVVKLIKTIFRVGDDK